MKTGILLSGPPASGKDSVTAALEELDPAFVLFPRLKAGSGRMLGYRETTIDALDQMESEGLIMQRHERYGNSYAVDRPYLAQMLADGCRPIIHVGRLENLNSFRELRDSFFSVLLWASRDLVSKRLASRGDALVDDRLAAWGEELSDVLQLAEPGTFDAAFDTGAVAVATSAQLILQAMTDPRAARDLDAMELIARVRASASA